MKTIIEIESLLKSFMLVRMRFSVKLKTGEVLDNVTIKHRHESGAFFAEKRYKEDGEWWTSTFPLVIADIDEVFNVRPPIAEDEYGQAITLVKANIDNEIVGVLAPSERFSQNQIKGYLNF